MKAQSHFAAFENNALLKTLVNVLHIPIMIVNSDREIVYANAALFKFLKLEGIDDIIGLSPGQLFRCSNSSAGETNSCGKTEGCALCGANNAFIKANDEKKQTENDVRIIQKINSGINALDLWVSAAPFPFENEQFIFYTIVDQEDKNRRRVLEKIFFHDILNTASWVKATTQLLRMTVPGELKNDFQLIEAGIDTLSEEIASQKLLLDAETRELSLNIETIEPADILAAVEKMYRPIGELQNKKLLRYPSPPIRTFRSDFVLVKRVVGNMVKNALEAVKEKQVVTFGARDEQNGIRFWVHNESYIPKDIRMQIFQRSFSTKGKGRGLGTYSIKLIGENYLNGKVTFTSTELGGTCFCIVLPVEDQVVQPSIPVSSV